MVYAVSSIGKEKHSDHISVLKKETDKFQYEDMVFPADYNSIEAFEERKKVCVFMQEIDPETNDIRLSKPGNIDYFEQRPHIPSKD